MAAAAEDKEMWKKVFSKKQDIVFRNVAGESILVPVRGTLADMQRIFSLNNVGARIWNLLDGRRNLGDVRDEIFVSFDTGDASVEKDIVEFVDELMKADLISEGN